MFGNFRSKHSNNLQTTYPHPIHPNTEKVFGSPKIHTEQTPSQQVCMGLRISLWISVVTDWFGDSIQNPRVRGSSRIKTHKSALFVTPGRRYVNLEVFTSICWFRWLENNHTYSETKWPFNGDESPWLNP